MQRIPLVIFPSLVKVHLDKEIIAWLTRRQYVITRCCYKALCPTSQSILLCSDEKTKNPLSWYETHKKECLQIFGYGQPVCILGIDQPTRTPDDVLERLRQQAGFVSPSPFPMTSTLQYYLQHEKHCKPLNPLDTLFYISPTSRKMGLDISLLF